MSQVTRRTVAVNRHEYRVPSDCAYVEIQRAISQALAEMPDSRARFEDACRIRAEDEWIVVYWIEEQNRSD